MDDKIASRVQRDRQTSPHHRPTGTPDSPTRRSMTVRIIEIVISPKGETTVQTKGFASADCLQASKWLEQALGIATTDNKTAEYYQPATIEQPIQEHQ